MNAGQRTGAATPVFFVCVRGDHHRHRGTKGGLREHHGATAYCPADAATGHVWMPTLSDTARLGRIGLCPPECEALEDEPEQDDLELVRPR